MLFAKADAVRGDRIAEVLPQFGAIIKLEVKTTLLGNAEKLGPVDKVAKRPILW